MKQSMQNSSQALGEIIYKKLLNSIVQGRINAGEKLNEMQLAKEFSVSRTPIREALLRLEREGFLSHTKHVGSVVNKISNDQVRETYELIALLEGQAIRNAVKTMDDKDVSNLRSLHERMAEAVKNHRFSQYVKMNSEFHDYFVKRGGNRKLRDIVKNLRGGIYRSVAAGQTLPLHVSTYLTQHEKIIQAVSDRKGAQAGRLMSSHLMSAHKYLLEVMNDLEQVRLY